MSVADTTATPSSETDADDSFLTAISDALEDAGASDEHVDRVVAEAQQLLEERDELRQRVDTLEQRLDEVETELDEVETDHADLDDYVRETFEYTAKERAGLSSRVAELEESDDNDGVQVGSDGETTSPPPEGNENGLHDTVRAVTPLEDAVNFPPRVAERELSENRLRGRFIARDPKQYCTNVQGGWMITPSDMRTVISAYQGGGSVHPETLRRVREFLNEWGNGEVTIRQREDGTNVVVFSDEIVDRIVKITDPDHEVVTGETAVPG
jgi:hypothetical protein